MTLKELIKKVQLAYKEKGETLTVDGDYGPITTKISEKYETKIVVTPLEKKEEKPANTYPITPEKGAPWLDKAKADRGKKETDPDYNKKMSAKWSLVGLNLGTIAKSWAAWCGLSIAVWLAAAGFTIQPDGAAAKNWAKYGQAIAWKTDGLPAGAIAYTNHNAKCGSGSGNHVTLVETDVAAADIIEMVKNSKGVWEYRVKSGATFPGLGGNQGNMVKTSYYPVKNICAVRWPLKDANGKAVALPAPVKKSTGSKGAADPKETTR